MFVSLHAAAATIALAVGLGALPAGRLVRLHLAAVVLMAAALVPAVLVDWATTPVGARGAIAALSVLAAVMVARAALAVRGRPQRTGGPTAGYLGHVGFVLIALADGFAVVAAIRAGLPGYAVAALASGVATAAGATTHIFALQNTTTTDMAGGIVGFSGVRTSSPVDVHGALTGTNVSATLPSVTTTVAGTMLVHLTTKRQEALLQPGSTSPLWSLKSSTTGTDNQGVSAGYEAFAGPGATPTRTASPPSGTASLEWIGQTVALRPASGPPSASLTWTATPSS